MGKNHDSEIRKSFDRFVEQNGGAMERLAADDHDIVAEIRPHGDGTFTATDFESGKSQTFDNFTDALDYLMDETDEGDE
jgi:hypothetical protein